MKVKIPYIHILVSIVIILIDQITKWFTVAHLKEFESVVLIPGFFNFTFVKNAGAAWGIFSNGTLFLTIFSIFILCLFLYMYYTNHDKYVRCLLMFIIAGAIGNLIDRIRLNYVIDFLDFTIFGYHFPVFNVADIAVSLGAIILFGYLLIGEKKYASR